MWNEVSIQSLIAFFLLDAGTAEGPGVGSPSQWRDLVGLNEQAVYGGVCPSVMAACVMTELPRTPLDANEAE